MIEVILDFARNILKVPVLRRLIVVLFLPNVLVWGFVEVGIDNKYNPMWLALVGPYWWLEKIIFKFAFWGATSAVVILVFARLVSILGKVATPVAPPAAESEQKVTILKSDPNAYFDKAYEILLQQQQAFKALPLSEQLEIKKQQAAESILLKAQWEKETAHIIKAKELRRNEKESELLRTRGNHTPPASPEDAKRNALRDITGRGA
ncbi:MAG: hypothetical protein WCH11_02705 [Bdellovibrio sp.]